MKQVLFKLKIYNIIDGVAWNNILQTVKFTNLQRIKCIFVKSLKLAVPDISELL